jgi:thiol:disulfide interchange protein DsbD
MKRLLLTLFAGFLSPAAFAQGAFAGFSPEAAHTRARLVLSAETAKPGETIWAGVELTTVPHWHTYWRFAGIGIPTTVTWTVPPGISAGEINWPVPKKNILKAGDDSFVTYVYEDRVVLLIPLQLGTNLAAGLAQAKAGLSWLECADAGQCVPQKSEVSAAFTVGGGDKPSADAALIEQWRGRLPRNDPSVKASAQWETAPGGDTRAIIIDWETSDSPADFYPFENQASDVQGLTTLLSSAPGHIRLRKEVKKSDTPWMEKVSGLLVGKSDSTNPAALAVTLPILAPAPAAVKGANTTAAALALMLLFAFAGGLILNVMPCVLPVIALKVLGFVNQSKESPDRVRRLGLVYGGGVLASFLVLAGVAIAAQKTGEVAGWGDAFRLPAVQLGLTVLMTLIALNLFGVFEVTLGAGVMGSAAGLSAKEGYGGAFCNGVLATVLATPCTAPFVGAAFALAIGQPAGVTALVFLAVGFGLAFPFVLVCWQPRLFKLLPKPGAWMEKFKMAMGFPMLATAAWLVWVTARNSDDMLWLELFLVVLALAAWIWGAFVQRGARRRGLAAAACILLLTLDYLAVLPSASATGIDWQPWSGDAVEQARQAGHPVLVDFTARSCLTCKVNKATSLEIAQTRAKLKAIGAVAFEADYTHEDPGIKRELERHHSPGVPLVLVFSKDPGREPQELPTVLTPAIVLSALDQAAR